MSDVRSTGLSIDLRQFLATPKFIEAIYPSLDLKLLARLPDIGQIDGQRVGAVDVLDIPSAALWLVLLRDVHTLHGGLTIGD